MADQNSSVDEPKNSAQDDEDNSAVRECEEKLVAADAVDGQQTSEESGACAHGSESAHASEDVDADDDAVITLGEVVEEQERLNADAEALLGGQDHTVCTYPEGYKPRQPLYSCHTCAQQSGETGAVCLGCSLACHDGHQLFELYTKRSVCCDCGNSKFANKCTLYAEKLPVNARNSYNQNYRGLYCSCERPYPDPEDPVSDNMVQCIVCEDWFHTRHLSKSNESVQQLHDVAEMICSTCVERLPFLRRYQSIIPQMDAKEGQVDVDSVQDDSSATDVKKCLLALNVLGLDEQESSSDKKGEAILWHDPLWRTKLCRCNECDAMYDRLNVQFLIDPEDTLAMYEQRAAASKSCEEEGEDELVKALVDNVDHNVAVEMIHGYNSLKDKLGRYLKRFADEGKVVQEGDINAFFSKLRETDAAKRPRLMPPNSCH